MSGENKGSDREARREVRRTRTRKFFIGVNAIISMLLMVILWSMVNYLASRHHRREDWSQQQITQLSLKTEDMLKTLDRPVQMIVFADDSFAAMDELKELLQEYQNKSRRIQLEFVDPVRDQGRTEELMTDYGISEKNHLVLVTGRKDEVISLEDMVLFEENLSIENGVQRDLTGFEGERLVTSALMRLTQSTRPVVYFLTGHGEKQIDLFERQLDGFSEMRVKLEEDNVEVRTLSLDGRVGVPADCGTLVIAGPKTRISQPELDILDAWLREGGRLMVLTDSTRDGGLTPLLKQYGIQLLPDWVVDSKYNYSGADVWVSNYAKHPTTKHMKGVKTIFLRPRSVMPTRGNSGVDKPVYYAIAACSEHGWAELDLENSPVVFDPDVDQAGPVPVAAVVEQVRSDAGDQAQPIRLVVFGDSDFAGNYLSNEGGQQLFGNCINWLLDRDHLISIPPKSMQALRLELDRVGIQKLAFSVCVVLPLSVGALGMLVWWRRRR